MKTQIRKKRKKEKSKQGQGKGDRPETPGSESSMYCPARWMDGGSSVPPESRLMLGVPPWKWYVIGND